MFSFIMKKNKLFKFTKIYHTHKHIIDFAKYLHMVLFKMDSTTAA